MAEFDIEQVFSGFDGSVRKLEIGALDLESVPSWWTTVASGSSRDGARRAAEAWADWDGGQFTRIRELLTSSAEVFVVQVEDEYYSGPALAYVIAGVDVRGSGPESAVWLGRPPRSDVASFGNVLGDGVSGTAMNRFYGMVHDGLNVRPTGGWAEILAFDKIEDWGSSRGESDDDLEFFSPHPYVPQVGNLMVLWEESAGGIAVLLDRSTDCVWINASGELDYVSGPFVDGKLHDIGLPVLFNEIEQRILVNFK